MFIDSTCPLPPFCASLQGMSSYSEMTVKSALEAARDVLSRNLKLQAQG